MTYTLSVAEAASQLGELVHRLHASDTVVLVENNVPVAELVPRTKQHSSPQRIPTHEDRHAALEAFHQLHTAAQTAQSLPGAEEITDEIIRAEIAAYRRGE
jgi:antitoxin (DNA-binding transcriptional repressor) of toxin-antitoxin stability system